jgi:hypothetical protein
MTFTEAGNESAAGATSRDPVPEIRFASASDLATAMRRAEAAHAKYEARIGAADPNWPDWYASYMAAEQGGAQLPT